ncbi:MAG TPA: hypothetical protein VFZ61_26345 [Polyangiales bacterium]
MTLSACDADGSSEAARDAESADAEFSEGDGGAEADADEDARVESDAATEETQNEAGAAGPDASAASTDSGTTRDAAVGDAAAGPAVDRANPQLYELTLDPHVLDPSTKDSLSIQYAQLDTRAQPRGQLVVFLPGANNTPRDWRDHGRVLAGFGFHVLIPHYNNRWSSNGSCDGKGGSCADDTRWEALTGENSSAALEIARADSAEGRVIAMIRHLASANTQGDWEYYLSADGGLSYGMVIIAGISHGAASAGLYAARRPFARNVMHSGGPAGSAAGSKMTPLSAWYGFAHTGDDAFSAITNSWKGFMLPGEPTSIDGQAPPFGDSHRLTSSASSSYPHGSTAAHSSSPKDAAGKYVFEGAWRHLYGAPLR